MRRRDEDTGEFLAPSRSEQRRAALDVLALGERLAGLTPTQLAKLPVPESLLPHIADTRRMTAHGARKRQVAFLAKQMRREADETLDAIRDALEAGGAAPRRDTSLMHRAETWRGHPLGEGPYAQPASVQAQPPPTPPSAPHQAAQ